MMRFIELLLRREALRRMIDRNVHSDTMREMFTASLRRVDEELNRRPYLDLIKAQEAQEEKNHL